MVITCQLSFKNVSNPSSWKHAAGLELSSQSGANVVSGQPERTGSRSQRKQLFRPSMCLSSALNHHQNQTLHSMCACCSGYSVVVVRRFLFFFSSGMQQVTNSLKMFRDVQWQFHQKILILHVFSKTTKALISKIVIFVICYFCYLERNMA